MDHRPVWQPRTDVGQRLLAAIAADPQHTLLALDFDGTLSPIVADPTRAVIHPRSRALLHRLLPVLGQVAIVTGRPVAMVRELADLTPADWAGLVVLGQYGVERWDLGADQLRSPEPPVGLDRVREAIPVILAGLAAIGVETTDAWLEDKGRAVALHTRRAAKPQQLLDLALAQVALVATSQGLVVEPGRFVVEVRAPGVDKADALTELLAEHDSDPFSVVVMCGDDLGDLPAFDLVQHLAPPMTGAVVVSGSPEQSVVADRADVLADGPDGIADWLQAVVDAVGC